MSRQDEESRARYRAIVEKAGYSLENGFPQKPKKARRTKRKKMLKEIRKERR